MTTTIVTRATKGGRLSFTDMDNNLLNLKATADAAAVQATTYTKTEVDAAITSATPSFSTLTGKPTTVTGYGITDAYTKTQVDAAISLKANSSSLATVATSGSYADLTGKPTIPSVPTTVSAFTNDSGYQTSSQVNTAIQAVVGAAPAALDTLAEIATQLASDETAVASLVTTVSGKADKATTIAGYGITDAYTKTQVDSAITSATPSFSTLTGKPTTLSGYGITDSMTASAISTAIGVETSRATTAESLLAPKASPTFTGTVSGITAAMVGLGNVNNTTDLLKPVSTATQTALDLKATLASPTFTGTVSGITASMVGLGNVTNVAQLAATQTHAITGDVTAPATALSTGTIATTLATVTQAATGNFVKVTLDTKGRVTGNTAVVQADITGLLGAGSISNTMLANGAVANLSGTNTGDETAATIKTKLGITTLSGTNTGDQTTITGNAGTATKLATPVNINGVAFDGSAAITINAVDSTARAPLASPALTGTPTAPTALATDNSTTIATTAYVTTKITNIINAAPAALDTLGEIATQLASDETAAAALTTAVSLKAPLASPTFTGTVSGITAAMVGLGSVNNTADLAKPVSTATTTAIGVETTRATAAEAALTTALNAAVARITALENALLSITWSTSI